MSKSLDEIADELYGLPPAQFVSARDDEVANARAAGDKDAAKTIAGLRRPTVAAWMINLLALQRRDKLAELIDIGAALREAQSNLKGTELRDLTSKRRTAVSALVNSAAELAVKAGAVRSGLPATEVEMTLTAALASADIASDVQSARLVKTAHYDGFGEMPRPDLQVVPGGRSEQPKKSVKAGQSASKAGTTSAPKAGPSAASKRAPSTPEPREEIPKVSSAALARRRSAARKLRQAESALAAARDAYEAAVATLRSAEEAEASAREAYDAAEQELQ